MPKALCPASPVDRLLDRAVRRAEESSSRTAVNTHHHHDQIERFMAQRHPHADVIVEDRLLGTGGAVGNIREWLGDDDLLLLNADTVLEADSTDFVGDWDGERLRMLVVADAARADFHGMWRYVGVCLIPNRLAVAVTAAPANLSEELFAPEWGAGRVELVLTTGFYVDCATPRDLLMANLSLSGGATVVSEGAVLSGTAQSSLLMPHSRVMEGESLQMSIRLEDGATLEIGGGG
jgi:hypothetical protein